MMRLPIYSYFFALVLAAATSLSFSGAARAEEPRTINDCEKIQAADAYNQCLAKFGPTSKLRNLEPERPGDIKSNGAEAAASAKPLASPARKIGRRHGGGRRRLHFTITHRRHR